MLPSYRPGSSNTQLFDVDDFFNTSIPSSASTVNQSTVFGTTGNTDPFSGFTTFRNAVQSNPSTTFPMFPSLSSTNQTPRLSTRSPFPQQQDKYRLTMTLHGYNRDDIKTYIENERLVVFARHLDQNGDDYQLREFKRHFFVPKNVDPSRMTTNLTRDNLLVVEIPVNLPATSQRQTSSSPPLSRDQGFHQSMQQQQQQQQQPGQRIQRTRSNSAASTNDYYTPPNFVSNNSHGSDNDLNRSRNAENKQQAEPVPFDFEKFFTSPFEPRIIDDPDLIDQKKLRLKMNMVQYLPEQIHLSLKQRELTLQVQENNPNDFQEDGHTAAIILQTYKVLLPPKTDLTNLKSKLEDGILYIEAPYSK